MRMQYPNTSQSQSRAGMSTSTRRNTARQDTTMRRLGLLVFTLLLWPALAFGQGTYSPQPAFMAVDNSGNIVSGGKLCSYVAGTTTAASTYSDVALTVANANPVIADSAGRMTVFLSPGNSYKFVLRQPGTTADCTTGTILWTRDNITAVPSSASNVDVLGTAGVTFTAGQVAYLSDGSGALTAGLWYATDADFTYASLTPIVGIATGAITAGTAGTFRIAGRVSNLVGLVAGTNYYVSATAGALTSTAPTHVRYVGRADSTTSLVVVANPTQPNVDNSIADGRLTLTTGTPVTTADVTGVNTVYYTPYKGNRIALYDGTAWNVRVFSQMGLVSTSLTASRPYDIFIYDSAGTPMLDFLVWTNDTTRATALTTQDGVYVKSGDTTRRYVGTVYVSAATTFNDSVALRHVWNYYHRLRRPLFVAEDAASWNYTTAAFRQFNADATNQVDVMIGVAETTLQLNVAGAAQNNGAGGATLARVSIGEDSAVAALATVIGGSVQLLTAGENFEMFGSLTRTPAVGRHYYTALEYSGATGVTSWLGVASLYISGLSGWIEG